MLSFSFFVDVVGSFCFLDFFCAPFFFSCGDSDTASDDDDDDDEGENAETVDAFELQAIREKKASIPNNDSSLSSAPPLSFAAAAARFALIAANTAVLFFAAVADFRVVVVFDRLPPPLPPLLLVLLLLPLLLVLLLLPFQDCAISSSTACMAWAIRTASLSLSCSPARFPHPLSASSTVRSENLRTKLESVRGPFWKSKLPRNATMMSSCSRSRRNASDNGSSSAAISYQGERGRGRFGEQSHRWWSRW